MSIIQALRHFSTYGYGNFLSEIAPNLDKLKDLSSPIYRLELMMVGRLLLKILVYMLTSSCHQSRIMS